MLVVYDLDIEPILQTLIAADGWSALESLDACARSAVRDDAVFQMADLVIYHEQHGQEFAFYAELIAALEELERAATPKTSRRAENKKVRASKLKARLQSGVGDDQSKCQFEKKFEPKEVAEMLGWSLSLIYERIKTELLKEEHGISVIEGRRRTYRIPESVVLRWEKEDTHPVLDKAVASQPPRRKPATRVVKFADLGKKEA